jgi:hypothetical protein
MELRTVRRVCTALAFASLLGLAGANPASAEELGWFEQGLLWFSGLWGAEEAGAKLQAGGDTRSIWTMDSMDKGMGLDPNGEPIVIQPPSDVEDL